MAYFCLRRSCRYCRVLLVVAIVAGPFGQDEAINLHIAQGKGFKSDH